MTNSILHPAQSLLNARKFQPTFERHIVGIVGSRFGQTSDPFCQRSNCSRYGGFAFGLEVHGSCGISFEFTSGNGNGFRGRWETRTLCGYEATVS